MTKEKLFEHLECFTGDIKIFIKTAGGNKDIQSVIYTCNENEGIIVLSPFQADHIPKQYE